MPEMKVVTLIQNTLPLGMIANTAAILGTSLGSLFPELVGPDVVDAGGQTHAGIIQIPVPILSCSEEELLEIQSICRSGPFPSVKLIDFTDVAASCKTYDAYIGSAAEVQSERFHPFGLCLYGTKKEINRLCGRFPLLR